jgi:hypothetical protein
LKAVKKYKLSSHVDVQRNQDAVDDGDTIVRVRDTFFVLTIPISEMENDKTEARERKEFNDHSSKTQSRTNLPSIRVGSKKLSSPYHQLLFPKDAHLLPE